MSNNCLVTKLKGTVQNDNLPEYKTIYLNLFGAERRVGNNYSLLIGVGQGKTVTLSSLYPFHPSVATAPGVTEYVLSNTALISFQFIASEMPSTPVENAIKITGDIYDLTACSTYGSSSGALIDFTTKSAKNSIESLNYASSLVSAVGCPGSIVSDNVEVMAIQDYPITNNKDYSSMVSENNNIKYFGSEIAQNNAAQGVLTSSLTKYHNLKYLMVRPVGSIISLPLSIISLGQVSSLATGSLEDFVADRRTKGITTGYLAIKDANYAWTITYNGTPIKDLSTSVRPIIDGYSFLCWDSTNIWWASNTPEGYTSYESPFWVTKAVLNGEL